MTDGGVHAELYINGELVGDVRVCRAENSWHFGLFAPRAAFAPYAAVFGRWSLLMHADEDADRLSAAAADELRATEIEIDRLRARLRFVATDRWLEIRQVNIDGDLIDWKT